MRSSPPVGACPAFAGCTARGGIAPRASLPSLPFHQKPSPGRAGDRAKLEAGPRLLDFWRFYHSAAPPVARAALSVRDLLAWAGFINTASPHMDLLAAYAHGAYLILLDGIGLGLGMPAQVHVRSPLSPHLLASRVWQVLEHTKMGGYMIS